MAVSDAVVKARTRTVWELARLAEVSSPDSETSPGAKFLRGVSDAVAYIDPDSRDEDTAHEVADSAVPVMTHTLWTTFVDLCAYQEDVSELGYEFDADATDKYPSVALYMIAERLAAALLAEDAGDADDEA